MSTKKIPTMKEFPSNSWLKDVDACLNSVQIFKLYEHYFNLSNIAHFGFSWISVWCWLVATYWFGRPVKNLIFALGWFYGVNKVAGKCTMTEVFWTSLGAKYGFG